MGRVSGPSSIARSRTAYLLQRHRHGDLSVRDLLAFAYQKGAEDAALALATIPATGHEATEGEGA